jgi:hypothetical protein
LVTSTNEVETKINARIIAGTICYHALSHLLKKRCRTHSLRVGLYKAVIRPVVIYGAESWTLVNKMERALMTQENKILRIYVGQHREMVLENKMNQKIYNKFKSPDMLTVIKVRRLEWLGQIVRMDGEKAVKNVLESKPGGERK